MFDRRLLVAMILAMGLLAGESLCQAQQQPQQVLSPSPPNVEYQYQLYYPRWFGWPGPGLSLGGSLPSRGREGISSFYGRPLPVPLGSGVFVNSYGYATQLPGFNSYGLASAAPLPSHTSQSVAQTSGYAPGMPMGNGVQPAAAGRSTTTRKPASNAATLQRSREMTTIGDEHFRQQKWTQAFVNYRNAVEVASDNAEAHVHLGFAQMMLNRFPEAAKEFKQALSLDPSVTHSGETLSTMFGPDSETAQNDLTRNVAYWAREDLKDQDHLFLLGLVLQYNRDPRSGEILQAALQLPGESEHLVALLTPPERGPVAMSPDQPPLPPLETDAAPADAESHSDVPPPPSPANKVVPAPEPLELPKLPELNRQPVSLR